MSRRIVEEGHTSLGRWILVPVADLTTPKGGRLCMANRWWAVTENDEVLFFDTYCSPQCNPNRSIVERLGKGFDAPSTTPRFIELAYIPHRCSDYL